MKKSFIPLTALALLALVSCGPTNNPTSSEPSEPASSQPASSEAASEEDAVNSITITNKEELQAAWPLESANRTIGIATDPAGNVNLLINQGKIKITSSNEDVVGVTGRVLSAKKVGTSTITVAYGDKSDTVEVSVAAAESAITLYGTVHAGTAEDPLDNADAVKVAEATGTTETEKYYYVKGVVASFRDAPSSYGNVSYYLKAEGSATKFLVYRAVLSKDFKADGSTKVTDDDIWVGATVTAKVKIVNYMGNTPETSSGGEITKVEGTKPEIHDIEATVAEAVAATKALDPNTTSTDNYIITGYVVATSSEGFYIADTKGAITPTQDNFLVYGYSGANAAQCTLNAKIKVKCTLKYYVSTSTTGKYAVESGAIESVEILEPGDAPVAVEEIDVAKALEIANALGEGATSEKQYAITGVVKDVTTAWSTQYNNMSFTLGATADATDVITVFRTGAAEGTDTSKIVAGAKVKVTAYLMKYVTTADGGSKTTTLQATKGTTEVLTDGGQDEGDKTVTDTTVAKAADQKGGLTAKTLYRITGIIEGLSHSDVYGNAYLTDPETGESVQVYGLTGTQDDKVFDFNASSDSKFFVNPKDATTSLADVNNGDQVTVKVGWCTFSSSTEIFGIVESHAASTATYSVDITANGGTVAADKEAYAYGEKVSLTVTPDEGKIVDQISASNAAGKGINIAKEGDKYTFDATCVNKVTVTFKDANETKVTATWDCSTGCVGLPSDAYPESEAEFTANIGTLSIKAGAVDVKQNNGYMMMKKSTGFVYTKDALPGSIVSVTLNIAGGASDKTNYAVNFGTEALSTFNSKGNVNISKGASKTFTPAAGENDKFFQIAIGNANNGQIASVTVVYDTAK